ncbi:Inositol-1,4,5-trisphosphate 5-phosphatase 4 isoform 2 [Olea europaea subsp. europaea]|uniref:Inositol-1,4,5-trisphosphate 5-phosphatase 4 isoform 2 n=1 Tax=Olea europaea subsp. europaea TaxID=158383 RepID=A0A8S0UX61_OLEEU|nr:Inositol-1,4,5-trisphosphate 5-phosphatase 4 isoform 2 [Olea europaea subsp. europaea]
MILFFKTHHIILLLITIHAISHSKVQALKALFYPRDILPLLPRQVSWPILNTLNNAEDLLPAFVGTATTVENHLQWKGACFYNNSAWLEFHNKSKTEFGGGTLHIKVRNAHSWTCMDLYLFATPYRVTWDYYFLSREHTLEFKEWHSKSEYEYVKNRGISIFLLQAGMLGTLKSLWEVFPLFTNTNWGENSNVAFLQKHMGATFEERPKPWVTNISADDINSGDFLVLSKIRGLWGGFETLEKWVTGSYAGHAAVCLRDSEGKLWVGESGRDNEQNLSLSEILVDVEKRGSSFGELLAVPEQDNWVYVDGKSTSCIAFVFEMYKEAGLFGSLSSAIQVTEFTIKDAYTLKFFENNSSRLPKWCNDVDRVKLPFCQIRGRYRMELPGYNTMDPYPHMNERCPSLPPKYSRPTGC